MGMTSQEKMLRALSQEKMLRALSPKERITQDCSAGDVLQSMADTFKQRQAVYGSNWLMVEPVMKALLTPDQLAKLAHDQEVFHLFSLMIVKLTRFAVSDLTHLDSVHDLSVYGAMIESILTNREKNKA